MDDSSAGTYLAGISLDEVRGKNALTARADALAGQVEADDVDAVVIPGGWAPDKLRRYGTVTGLVKAVHDAGKPIGVICHGDW